MPKQKSHRPVQSPLDPNLTILPSISAPVDQGILIPYPPRSRWAMLLIVITVAGLALLVLAYFFLRASSLG